MGSEGRKWTIAHIWSGRDTLEREESICGGDEYEQGWGKGERIFVKSESLAGAEMDKSGIQKYEGMAEYGMKEWREI